MRILGLPAEPSSRLLAALMAHATERRFVYTHRWRADDLVMWDNRCTMHRGTDDAELRWKRDMHRATVSDEVKYDRGGRAGVGFPRRSRLSRL